MHARIEQLLSMAGGRHGKDRHSTADGLPHSLVSGRDDHASALREERLEKLPLLGMRMQRKRTLLGGGEHDGRETVELAFAECVLILGNVLSARE